MKIFYTFLIMILYITFELEHMEANTGFNGELSAKVNTESKQFCWTEANSDIGNVKIDNGKTAVDKQSFTKTKLGNLTQYCITVRDTSLHTISIPVEADGLTLHFRVNNPLMPKFKFIKFFTTPTRIIFQLSPQFAGLSLQQVSCNILVSVNSKFILKKIYLDNKISTKTIGLSRNKKFEVYYTCILPTLSEISTGIVHERGKIIEIDEASTLKPLVIIPFRRFLLVKWTNNFVDNFELVISKDEKILKVFHVLNENLKTSKLKDKVKRMVAHTDYEMLGYFTNDMKEIYAMLEISDALKPFTNYKFSVYWIKNESIKRNSITFWTLQNYVSGVLNAKHLNPDKYKYYETLEETFDLYQKISEFDRKLVEGQNLPYKEYKMFRIFNAINSHWSPNHTLKAGSKVPLKKCEFYPYYFVMLQYMNNVEIVSIPYSRETVLRGVTPIQYSSNHSLKITWRKPDDNNVLPGAFLVIIKVNEDEFHKCYQYECGTCPANYIKESLRQLKTKRHIQSFCEIRNYSSKYKMTDKKFMIITDDLPHSKGYILSLLAAYDTSVVEGKESMTIRIDYRWWKENKLYVIISIVVVLLIFLICCGVCLKFTSTHPSEKTPKDNMYDIEEL